MSDIWSFYEFSLLMEADTELPPTSNTPANMQPTGTGRTDRPKLRLPPNMRGEEGGSDPLEQAPRHKDTISKGRQDPVKQMSDQEMAKRVAQEMKKKRNIADKLSTYNSVNKNWATGYWAMINTLKELGYDVPQIPIPQGDESEIPRWIPTRDGGYKPGNPDGPYVTVNTGGEYSVNVSDRKNLKKLLGKIAELTGQGAEVDTPMSKDRAAWMANLKDKGSEIDNDAEVEGQATKTHPKSVFMPQGKGKGQKVLNRDTMQSKKANTGQGPDVLGKVKRAESDPNKRYLNQRIKADGGEGPSQELADKVTAELEDKIEFLDRVATVDGEGSDTWNDQEARIKSWAQDILKNRAAALKGTEIWDQLQMIAQGVDANEWNEMNEWLNYSDTMEHIFE